MLRLIPTVLLCLSLAAPLYAARVEVFVSDNATGDPRQEALSNGFERAVLKEALDVIPGDLPKPRVAALETFLAPRAQELVQSYSGVRTMNRSDGLAASMDVRVNRSALKNLLRDVGVLATLDSPVPYTLSVRGPAMEHWKEIGRLQTLSGVVFQRDADLELELDASDPENWRGELRTGEKSHTAQASDLPGLWLRLWSRYFGGRERDGSRGGELLEVSGWYAAAGVEEFGRVLEGWNQAVDGAVLLRTDIAPGGIRAVWRVEAQDAELLRQQLDEYAECRELTYRLGVDNSSGALRGTAGARRR
ncbi:hypothetical protein [Desulfohalovibrio reitneri]|uniref:hypothetical protein n=1 Tax=Desulfohalovibrio reitneri TaxID=1307759 RepID=UPI0004A72D52|nr:hypothetical protein [Desulfohalovibrio reitneri]